MIKVIRVFGAWLGIAGLMLLASHASIAAGQLPDFTGMVEKYSAAVVNVSTTQKRSVDHGLHGLPHGFGGPGGAPQKRHGS